MILLDSSVVIDLFRAQDDRILDVILERDAAICGITRAEVLYGARDASHRVKLMAALDLFQSLALPEAIWDQVGDNLAGLRTRGLTRIFHPWETERVFRLVGVEVGIRTNRARNAPFPPW
jgi:predicted nucleic acid-binding protein